MGGQSHTAGPLAALAAVRPVNVIESKRLTHVDDDEAGKGLFSIPVKHTAYAGLLWEVTRPETARLIAAAPELSAELSEARTTLSILRTQVMVEIGRCADPSESRWDGVPEKLKERMDAIDAVLAKATGEGGQ